MTFEIGKITYKQWSEINRTLAGVSLELKNLRHNETKIESRKLRKEEVRNAQNVLSEIHRGAEVDDDKSENVDGLKIEISKVTKIRRKKDG
jgi:hypothetical protein